MPERSTCTYVSIIDLNVPNVDRPFIKAGPLCFFLVNKFVKDWGELWLECDPFVNQFSLQQLIFCSLFNPKTLCIDRDWACFSVWWGYYWLTPSYLNDCYNHSTGDIKAYSYIFCNNQFRFFIVLKFFVAICWEKSCVVK